ncbi:hypothetical protein RNQ23_25715, partial [Escherichia coli]|nr:hypothetical protein [Escherichia coli]
MGSCAAPSAKGDDKFITTDYLQQCRHDASTYGSQDNLNPLINEISKIISAAGNFDVKEERTAASLLQLSGNTSDFSYGRNSITLTASA